MVATQLTIAALLLCAAVSARHHKPEAVSEVSSDSAQPAETPAEPSSHRNRKKRWYSQYGFQQPVYQAEGPPGPPPLSQPPYDPFAFIYRRLDELTALIRQPLPPPPGPILVPYPIYISAGGCGCPSGGSAQEPMPNITIPNRVGADDDDYDDMPLRPLSFVPIKPDRPLLRPAPGVEHGSSQAGAQQPSPQQGREPSAFSGAGSSSAAAAAPILPQPSRCDIATLTCCHQRYTTNLCFSSFGCTEKLRDKNPCDAAVISNVVSIFQNLYRNN